MSSDFPCVLCGAPIDIDSSVSDIPVCSKCESRAIYDINGFDIKGYDRNGLDKFGYDTNGFNIFEIDKDGYNRNGYDREGYDREGYRGNYNREGNHRATDSPYDPDGYDKYGYNKGGFNREGNHRETGAPFDPDGYDRDGYNENGDDRNGDISPLKWRKIINQITEIPTHETSWTINKCLQLDSQDKALAYGWAYGEKTDEFTKARMLSARMAEKAAIQFYRGLGFNVEDISRTQISTVVNKNTNDWKLYDLLLDNEICIDVKNARTSLIGKVNYVEHCVSRFKENRKNKNITIAGVLSPYLQLYELEDLDSDNEINCFLGETSISSLLKLESRFTKRFLKISLEGMNFIPRYFFELPEKFYYQRNETLNHLKQVSLAKIPSLQECNCNPIPAYISSGLDLPHAWLADLLDWQRNFCARIKSRHAQKITMPILFLALLTHFLESLAKKKSWGKYSPALYRQLIYSSDDIAHKMPLGIYDQFKTIDGFITTLSTLWNYREIFKLNEFKLFKFNGVGLLQGKRFNREGYETILAYCGGFVSGMGKCGNNPLIIGKHENCKECGRLICDICGYCSSDKYCSKCADRMKKNLEKGINFPEEEYVHKKISEPI